MDQLAASGGHVRLLGASARVVLVVPQELSQVKSASSQELTWEDLVKSWQLMFKAEAAL